MKRPPIEKLRRLALLLILAVLVVSAATYAIRAWRARQVRKSVPVVESDVQQQAQGFTLSRSEAGRTLFVMRAARTVERQGRKTMLEEVSVVVYGREGDRADEIHTGRCEYNASGAERIFCPDPVTFEMGVGKLGTGGRLRIETSGVQFDQATGVAHTRERVAFRFPEGYGEGLGLRYQRGQPALVLEHEVEIVLPRDGEKSLRVRGRRLEYNSQERFLRLRPPLRLLGKDWELVADELVMQLNSAYQVKWMVARGQVTGRALRGARQWRLRADEAVAKFIAGKSIEQLNLKGQVLLESPGSQDTVSCTEAQIVFDSTYRWVERVRAAGGALVRSVLPAENRQLAAEEMELQMRAGGRTAEHITTLSRGILAVTLADGERREIEADRIQLEFDAESRLSGLEAVGRVEALWQVPGRLPQRTESAMLQGTFTPEGQLARAEQWGEFRFHEGEREATAGRVEYDAARGVFLLSEQPRLWDATLRLSAQRIELSQRNQHLTALGDTRTTYAGSAATQLFSSALPVHIAAEQMEGERSRPGEPGWARYAGQVRLWQGENRLEAETLELAENPRRLQATGQVNSLIVEQRTSRSNPGPGFVRVNSQRFTYVEAERHGLYEGKVEAEGTFGRLRSNRLELFLAESTPEQSSGVESARARGGVVIEQRARRAQAEEAEYRAADETLVLWGGEPQLFDPQYGVTRGARLTFRIADDSIVVESGTGSRTVTRRTWSQ